jgi:hypothetical protein
MKASHEKWVARDWGESWSTSRVGTRFADFDKTPPSQRTLRWYEDMHRGQCSIITQVHTGHVSLNAYLTRFGVVDSDLCQTCREPETVNHFLLTCRRFMQQRDILRRALLEDRRQQLTKKFLLGKSKNKSVLLAYVAAAGRFPRYTPAPS